MLNLLFLFIMPAHEHTFKIVFESRIKLPKYYIYSMLYPLLVTSQ